MLKKMGSALLSLCAMALVGVSFAPGANAAAVAAVDVADVVTGVSNQMTSVGSIGVAILGIVVAIAAYKWLHRVIK